MFTLKVAQNKHKRTVDLTIHPENTWDTCMECPYTMFLNLPNF